MPERWFYTLVMEANARYWFLLSSTKMLVDVRFNPIFGQN